MKKLILISIVVALFAACQSPEQEPMDDLMLKKAVKVDLCHLDEYGNYISISVSENALEAHLAHGDKYAFSPEGTYVFQYKGTYNHDYVIDYFDGVNFKGYGGYPAGDETYNYPYNQVLEGTVVDGIISGTTTYENGNTWSFTGTVDECGGIISLDGDWKLVTE